MATKKKQPFGEWQSSLSAKALAASGRRFGHLSVFQNQVYWLEANPLESGKTHIMTYHEQRGVQQLTDDSVNVRTRVHEMGGGDFCACEKGLLFIHDDDQRLYWLSWECVEQTASGQGSGNAVKTSLDLAVALTPEPELKHGLRYADFIYSIAHDSVFAVRESHDVDEDGKEVVLNDIVKVSMSGNQQVTTVVSGFDFYSFPRVSHDSRKLLWTCWNVPQMPWDGTELWVGHLDEQGYVTSQQKLVGGPKESIYQPQWCKDGSLLFVSDRSGWWNLYRSQGGKQKAIMTLEAEFGLPQWVFGSSTYDVIETEDDKITVVTRYQELDKQCLCVLQEDDGWQLRAIDTPVTYFGENMRCDGAYVYFYGASPSQGTELIKLHVESGEQVAIRQSTTQALPKFQVSVPKAIECDSGENRKTFGFFYPPASAEFEGMDDELPPLLVLSHGGPTAATHPIFNLAIQFWTSRGFAVVDVNYGGSTGYGREYRERLNGQWGVVDVEDCVSLVRFLVAQGKVDKKRVTIKGGSAGGFTTLCALTYFDDFAAGASRYGVADLMLLATDTHKFESRYLDQLVGNPETEKSLYEERSPILHTDRLTCPIILLQGLEDKVVPPSQAEVMVEALKEKGIPHSYVTFANEGHGFRQADNVQKAFESELVFFAEILGLNLAESLPQLDIQCR